LEIDGPFEADQRVAGHADRPDNKAVMIAAGQKACSKDQGEDSDY